MTRERAKELLPIMAAFAEGKAVEFRERGKLNWLTIANPEWCTDCDYRIKPEPREWWINFDQNGESDRVHSSKEAADIYSRFECVHVREVLP